MAHYAFLDKNNFVTEVIVGKDEDQLIDGLTPEEWYSRFRGQVCIRTSYSGSIRKNFAGIGYKYDKELDAFIPPKPHNSWILDKEAFIWNPPVEFPQDGKMYVWNENILNWEEVND